MAVISFLQRGNIIAQQTRAARQRFVCFSFHVALHLEGEWTKTECSDNPIFFCTTSPITRIADDGIPKLVFLPDLDFFSPHRKDNNYILFWNDISPSDSCIVTALVRNSKAYFSLIHICLLVSFSPCLKDKEKLLWAPDFPPSPNDIIYETNELSPCLKCHVCLF